ncbi:HAMP domain-containing protein [bacterium]|nr:HAMP domain-containing protein [bacterium]
MNIRKKIFMILSLLMLITAAVSILSIRFVSEKMSKEDVANHLETAVQSRAHHIKTVLANYKNLTGMMATGHLFINAVNHSDNFDPNMVHVKRRITAAIESHEKISRICLLNRNGIIVVSSHKDVGRDMSKSTIFLKGKEAVYIRDLHVSDFTGNMVLSVATPILVKEQFAGVIIFNFDAEKELFKITADTTGLGETGKIYLVNQHGFMISPSRFGDAEILKQKINSEQYIFCRSEHLEKGNPEAPEEVPCEYLDYSGVKVFGHHHFIQDVSWCLLAELDVKEANRQIKVLTGWLYLIFVSVLVFSFFIFIPFTRLLIKPVLKLHEGARKLAGGDLSFRLRSEAKDELGELSKSFDEMAERLQKHDTELDNIIVERTDALSEKIVEAENQRDAMMNMVYDMEETNKDLSKEIVQRKRAEEAQQLEYTHKMSILNAIPDGLYIVSQQYNIEYINSVIEREFGPIDGRKCYEYFHDRTEVCPWCKNGEVSIGKSVQWEWYFDKNNRYYDLFDSPLKNADGSISKFEIFHDITEHKLAEEQIQSDLKEKGLLLKEIHHRVKNNLQVIISLLGLQADEIKDGDALKKFEESRNRVRSMALVHEELYRSENFAAVDFSSYIKKLSHDLYRAYAIDQGRIELKVKVKDVFIGLDNAVPCGLIINELISNTLKHAFPASFTGKGKIEIDLYSDQKNEIVLIVKDNGVGLPKDLDIQKKETLGLQLIHILTEQIQGNIELNRKGGTKFTIRFR